MAPAQYARPKEVTNIDECFFYHTMELPQVGLVNGLWDLRKDIQAYLGRQDFRSKSVLELGPASGYISFYMESCGAEVVGYELSEDQEWDVVPYAAKDMARELAVRKEHIRQLNNSFWYAHRLMGSKVKVLYGSVYEIPVDLGPFDTTVVGSILLHLRDPFLALQRVAARTKATIIVTDTLSRFHLWPQLKFSSLLPKKLRRPQLHFIPDYSVAAPIDTWWRMNPSIIRAFLGVLGFEDTTTHFHRQPFQGKSLPLFTVVGKRTKGSIRE